MFDFLRRLFGKPKPKEVVNEYAPILARLSQHIQDRNYEFILAELYMLDRSTREHVLDALTPDERLIVNAAYNYADWKRRVSVGSNRSRLPSSQFYYETRRDPDRAPARISNLESNDLLNPANLLSPFNPLNQTFNSDASRYAAPEPDCPAPSADVDTSSSTSCDPGSFSSPSE